MTELLIPAVADSFAIYRQTLPNGEPAYAAGFPSYPANFTRDTINAGVLAGHTDMLATQLAISACNQGSKHDPHTGEQPGKIHHEFPGATLSQRQGLTSYNACDTTALFLIGAEALLHVDKDTYSRFHDARNQHLLAAAEHVISAVGAHDSLFWDTPPKGTDRYSLRVTYWKDSILPHAEGKEEPTYPVSYAQAHFIAARGLLSASHLLENKHYEQLATNMFEAGIATFMQPEGFTVYKDGDGILQQASSDELHALAYIPTKFANKLPLDAIKERARKLATPYGYMCTPADIASGLADSYHGDKIWVFEQAKIHYGARKFRLNKEATVAAAIAPHIGQGQELFGIDDDILVPEGNSRQLWSVAAAEYFAGNSLLHHTPWL